MALSTTQVTYEYTGNGSTVAFPFSSYANAASDIKVYVNGVLQSSGFTTTGSGTSWTVTFSTAPADTLPVVLRRSTPDTQASDYQNNDALEEDVIEGDLDKRTARSQEIADIVTNYSLQFNTGLPAPSSPVLPSAADRANKALTFDAAGKPQASTLSSGTLTNNALNVDFDPAGAGAETRSVEDKLREWVSVKDSGATGDGTETTKFQAAIDAFPSDNGHYQILVPPGSYTVGTLTEGSRSITWMLQAGATVTQGKLPGRVIRAKTAELGTPERLWTFGETPYTYPNVQITSAGGIASQASSGDLTATVNGLSSVDRLTVSARLSDHTDGLVPYAFDPGRNTFALRYVNPTGGVLTPNTRTLNVTVAKNTAYRQAFAISPHLGKDCFLVGVDMNTTKSAVVWRTTTAGDKWAPMYSVSATGIRDFVIVTDNTVSTDNEVFDTVLLLLVSDPSTAAQLVWRSTDGGATWTALTMTLSGGTAETTAFGGDVEGGQGNGGGSSYVIVGGGRGSADATVWRSTDGGATFGSPVVVDSSSDVTTCWKPMYISGAGASSVWLAFCHADSGPMTALPSVYRSIDGGATWTALSSVSTAGDNWQGVIKLASGTILASTTTNGDIYRSTDNGATWTLAYSLGDIKSSESKARAFAECASGIFCAGQDSGYIWHSIDDGRSWQRIVRVGRQFGPNCIAATDELVMIGGGHGFGTAKTGGAAVYRAMIESFNDSE